MAMDKRFTEIFTRLDAIEDSLAVLAGSEIESAVEARLAELEATKAPAVTKEQLMAIKGVGESTADAILELLNR